MNIHASRSDRVRRHTSDDVLRRIDARTGHRVARAARGGAATIDARLSELDREWDVERVLQLNAATLALTGVLLGLARDRRFFATPVVVLSFLVQHAVQGWCPPLAILRRVGVRTAREIECERHALKALRGDYGDVRPRFGVTADAAECATAALAAVSR